MKEKKQGFFSKVKAWWNELDQDTKGWLGAVAIWTVDGVLIGSAVTAGVKNRQMQKAVENAAAKGYLMGMIDTYQDVIQNPQQANVRLYAQKQNPNVYPKMQQFNNKH